MGTFSGFMFCGIIVVLAMVNGGQGATTHFRIASLFEEQFESMALAFRMAMAKANVYPIGGATWKILSEPETLTPNDSFEADRKICRMMKAETGIAAIFGPITEIPRAHVQSLSTAFEIPHVQAHFVPTAPRPDDYTVNLYPDLATMGRGFAAVIQYWKWKEFTVIYENNEGIIRLQEVLKIARGDDYRLTVRRLPVYYQGYVALLKEMKKNNEYRILIDCDINTVRPFLTQAMTVGMLSEYYHYHFTSLDLGVLDLDKFVHSHANITAMRLIDPHNAKVINVMTEWGIMESNKGQSPLMGRRGILTETALMYDAVFLFSQALAELRIGSNVTTTPLSCNKKDTWSDGVSLLNYMRGREMEGLSGRIRFTEGKRLDVTLGVIRLNKNGFVPIGSWHPLAGVNITESAHQKQISDLEALKNKTLRVVCVVDDPYVMKRDTPDEKGRMFEGFIIDLLDLLADRLGFKYEVYQQKNNAYGSLEDGKWTGIVGDLMERDTERAADLGAAGMTITYERGKVVEFTKPFLNLGITIIFKKSGTPPADLFSFLYPLSLNVWIYMIAAYLCVSFMLFVIARFTPYEWENPHPCNEESEVVENQFTILNCLWFTIGSLMQQGCDIAPKAISTRMVACFWWFFVLIIISSYTANLAAFLTTKRMDTPIKNAEDLSKQTKIKYGTLEHGSTNRFFKRNMGLIDFGNLLETLVKVSNISTYKRMWSYMSANPQMLVKNNDEGFKRVMESNYAYIAESTTIDYQVQRNCDLMQIGDLLDSKGYGLATPKDSPYINFISKEIIYLQEKQNISSLYRKWWKEKSDIKCEVVDAKKKNSMELGIENVGGVFIVLMGGSIFGVMLSFIEFLWKIKKNADADKQSFFSEMMEELRFVVKCKATKTLRRTPSKEMMDNGQLSASFPNNKLAQREVFD